MSTQPALPFVDLLKQEISELQEKLERNPTYIKLRAAERTLAAYGDPEQAGGRAAKRPKCATCGRYASQRHIGHEYVPVEKSS